MKEVYRLKAFTCSGRKILSSRILRRMAFFDKDGFIEPETILWYGNMSHANIADWLPYKYSPGH